MQVFSILQALDLIPARTLFPHPRTLVPFSRSSPLQLPLFPRRFTATSLLTFACSVLDSPAFLLWAYYTLSRQTEQVLFNYFRTTLPKPDNPDIYSVQAAQLDKHDHETIPGLETSRNNQQTKGLLSTLTIDFRRLRSRLLEVFGHSSEESTEAHVEHVDSEAGPTVPQDDHEPEASNEEGQDDDQARNAEDPERSAASLMSSPEDFEGPESRIYQPTYSIPTIDANNTHDLTPPTAEHDTIWSSSEGISPDPDPIAESTPVRVSNRRRNTDTVTMEVEISGRPPNVQLRGRPVFTSTPSADALPADETTTQDPSLPSRRHRESQQLDSKEPKHRVTLLSGYMADMLASHLAQHLSELLCLPLEALLVRTVALGFLAAARPTPSAQTSALGLTRMIYPPTAWFGLGFRGAGWRGVGDYAAKMMLCSVVEAAVGYGIWQVGATTTFWVGRRWFQWGRL